VTVFLVVPVLDFFQETAAEHGRILVLVNFVKDFSPEGFFDVAVLNFFNFFRDVFFTFYREFFSDDES